jgi:hypothetical protein
MGRVLMGTPYLIAVAALDVWGNPIYSLITRDVRAMRDATKEGSYGQ